MAISGSDKALMYALGGVMRGGASRGGYINGCVFINLNGLHVGWGASDNRYRVLLDSLTITDELDEVANRCTFRVKAPIGGTPFTTGREVIITQGSKNNLQRLFAGFTVDVRQFYFADNPAFPGAELSAVDYTWQLNFSKVTKQYVNSSATTIAKNLIATYAASSGFTTNNVEDDLPVLDEITYTEEDLGTALTRLARRIGAYWYVDYLRDIHLFFSEVLNGSPVDLTPTHKSLAHLTSQLDHSQCLTRVSVEGRGSRLLSNVLKGDTMIPLEAVDMFKVAPDVFVKAAFQGSVGGAQYLNFSGVVTGGTGTLVGPGVTPASAPTVELTAGTGIEAGRHDYAYTWVTASGETKPSAIGTVTHGGPITTPTVATTARNNPDSTRAVNELLPGAWKPGDTVDWAYTWSPEANPASSTPLSPIVSLVAVVASTYWNSPGQSARTMLVKVQYTADARAKEVYLWHRVNGGSWRCWNFGEPVGGGYDNYPNLPPPFEAEMASPEYSDVMTPPATGTAYQRTNLSGIAVGPTGTTQRKVYRTAANLSQLKLLQTIANNTATTATDSAADATLGANAPTGDTSTLPQPTGQANPGDSEIRVASTAPFNAAGGWAIIGNGEQVIRYTAVEVLGTLAGIPQTGIGAITAAVNYGTTISAAPMLTGIPSTGARGITTRELTAGDEMYVVVQSDDTARQATLAAEMKTGPGIREEWVQDRRLSIPEARARGKATLAARPLNQQTIAYTCRDLRTAAGKTITVNLPGTPTNLTGTFKIQTVTIDNFRPYPNQLPTFTVQASSARFSFEDLLRVMRHKE
jgi:hypothetical protein